MTPRRTKEFLPLGLYAALGDGRSVAIIGADGAIDWLCLPDIDSPPLFDRMLAGAGGGRFSITPTDADFTVDRRYRENSNVLEIVFRTSNGSARVTSSLNSGISGRLPWFELGQRVEGLEGSVAFEVRLLIGDRPGRATPWREKTMFGDILHVDGLIASLRTSDDIESVARDDDGSELRLTTAPGSRSVVALLASKNEPLILPTLATVDARIDRSDQAWREWAGSLDYDGPHVSEVRRSALALKLLLFSPSGAIAAAATNGLPERIGGKKNYDYRYAWVRDAAYTIKAFLRVGAVEEAKAAFSWMTATIRRHGRIRTMYALDGDLAPEQQKLELPGYRDSTPVLLGNAARGQLQLGVYGDVLETAALFVENGNALDLVTRRLLADLADQSADFWRSKDAGIWELDDPQHYTISKIGCWTALDRAVKLADSGQIDSSRRDRWEAERERIRAWIDAHCWSDEKSAYTQYAGTDKLDASLLLATRFGFADRERLRATRDAIVRELASGPLVYRYTGMREEEGSFLACAFWLIEAYALLGDRARAAEQMATLLEATGKNLGLLTEQQDPRSGEALGNLPQALSHLALIHAAFSLEETGAGAPE